MPAKPRPPAAQVLGFLGVGLDGDGHRRVTECDHFVLVGGSAETHERMQETAIRFGEALGRRGKRLPDVSPDEARTLREDYQHASLPVLRGLALDMVRADFRSVLRTQRAPTLIMAAENDPFVDLRELRRLAELMPRARVAVQPALAHGWTAEAVAEQRRWLADFLEARPR